MEKYLNIKRIIATIIGIKDEINENNDLCSNGKIIIKNDELKNTYTSMNKYRFSKLVSYDDRMIEVPIKTHKGRGFILSERTYLENEEKEIKYSIGYPTKEYLMFILSNLSEKGNINYIKEIRYKSVEDNFWDSLSNTLELATIRIEMPQNYSLEHLKRYVSTYKFEYMKKRNLDISEYKSIEEIFMKSKFLYKVYGDLEKIPERFYNEEIMEYYTMGIEGTDPFIIYISFYHVIEHYFDRIEDLDRRNLNERQRLEYILRRYVRVDKLKEYINHFDETYSDYYERNNVYFVEDEEIKINWDNNDEVYSELVERIYNIRNALVHSKSRRRNKQYRPYEHRSYLEKEVPLIRSVAELVVINSSEII